MIQLSVLASKERVLEDEKALIERATSGDNAALAALYHRHVGRVYRYLAFRVGNPADAEDLTQQVFLKAVQSLSSFRWRGVSSLFWLLRIAHNELANYRRRAARHPAVPLEDDPVASEESSEEGLEESLDRASALDRLRAAMGQLTELQRQVLALRFGGGLSVAETAQVLGKREGAVKTLQYSALIALRRVLKVGQ